MAGLAVHDKAADDGAFERLLPLIEAGATDDRNFVKKAVNWALRNIGKRNRALNLAAIACAERIRDAANQSAGGSGAVTQQHAPRAGSPPMRCANWLREGPGPTEGLTDLHAMVDTAVRPRVALWCLLVAALCGCGGGGQSAKCVPDANVDCACPTGQHGVPVCPLE